MIMTFKIVSPVPKLLGDFKIVSPRRMAVIGAPATSSVVVTLLLYAAVVTLRPQVGAA
jgi:hypothetical protein